MVFAVSMFRGKRGHWLGGHIGPFVAQQLEGALACGESLAMDHYYSRLMAYDAPTVGAQLSLSLLT